MSFSTKLFTIFFAVILISVFYFYRASAPSSPAAPSEPVFCTQEAKLCPDGSYVSRTGPNCEFTSCPSASDAIIISSPAPEEYITSPLIITGSARGYWFFEASFPVILTDWDGLIIAEGIATAARDWMTENYVPFRAELNFTKPAYGERGTLILKKDNPSGLPEHDAAMEIPVRFR